MNGLEMKQIACGKFHTLFLTENPRKVWATGANNFGQVGNDSNQTQYVPICVSDNSDVAKARVCVISAWHSSAAVTDAGELFVWGAGLYGEHKKPKKLALSNGMKARDVQVGGSFIVIVDENEHIAVIGAN